MAVFCCEIILSSMGKPDYMWSFFFYLDVISTITMILDISWTSALIEQVGEAISEGVQGKDDALRSGRTARIGARAGRVIRVIRLVRILKLYKAVYDARTKKQEEMEEDDWGDEAGEEDERRAERMKSAQESQVGKKLSELTTRRVIMLVLVMLLTITILQTQDDEAEYTAAQYGSSIVRAEFLKWQSSNDTSVRDLQAEIYYASLLKFIYWHSPYAVDTSAKYQLIYVGAKSSSESLRVPLSITNQTRLPPGAVVAWLQYAAQEEITDAHITPDLRKRLEFPWDQECVEDPGTILIGAIPPKLPSKGISLFREEVSGTDTWICPSDLRPAETLCAPFGSTGDFIKTDGFEWSFIFCFDQRPNVRSTAATGLITTIFICLVLIVASSVLSNDANKLVLNPLEQMMKRVHEIGNDPLVAMKMADEEFKQEEKEKAAAQKARSLFKSKGGGIKKTEALETVILEKTIIKLGSLLALGFGQAGANIIGQNMGTSHSAGVNVMIPGARVECVIGQARIQDFSIATEVLQGKVMTFVNQVAEIVHGIVDSCHGAPNKNNGETFLVVWRIADMGDDIPIWRTKVADLSVLAFAKIYGAVHRSVTLADYRGHPGMQQRLGTNFRVNMSFGVHAGWAIEGAVGSEFKIDASYLSPNVSIASSVEAATSTYNVPILISNEVIQETDPDMAAQCRLIDNVLFRGSALPIKLYSLDLDFMNLSVDAPRMASITWNSRQRFKVRQFLEAEKTKNCGPDVRCIQMFKRAEDLALMRQPYTAEFMHLFNMGYQNYSEGEWQVARRLLMDTSSMLHGEDGPSAALLHFMSTYGFKAPQNWNGVREIDFSTSQRRPR
jgi:class 3 adenylate cyclase